MSRFDGALRMVRTYLSDSAEREDWGDPHTPELTEVIRSCVECISVNRRGQGQVADGKVPHEALRQALGYVDEYFLREPSDDMTPELA